MANDYYLGNSRVKGAGVVYEYTKEELEEYIKCRRDPIYFIEKYVTIIGTFGKTLFKMYEFQKEMILAFTHKARVVIKSGRQQGKCNFHLEKVFVKHTLTDELSEIAIGDFYELCASNHVCNDASHNESVLDKRYEKLSDQVNRKFIDTIDLHNWEVDTDTGWEPIKSISKTVKYEKYTITTECGLTLSCADTHIIFDESGDEIFAQDSLGVNIRTRYGNQRVIRVEHSGEFHHMYDMDIDSGGHRFYTNDILSHNSITCAAWLFWFTTFHSDKNVAIAANKASTARGLLKRVSLMLESLPFFLQAGCREMNKGSLTFDNGSMILAAATSSSSIRGDSMDCILLDEFAFIENAYDFFTSTYPVISAKADSKIFMVSTPNKLNLFYTFFTKAKALQNGYHALEYNWRDVPYRDEKWVKETKDSLASEEQWLQEFEGEFLGNSNTLIPSGALKVLMSSIMEPLHTVGGVHVYDKPEEGHTYVMTVDVSRGKGLDYSTFSVFDVTERPYNVVATFRDNKISSYVYPDVINRVATAYNKAWVLIEVNDIGEQVVDILNYDLEYENIIPTNTATKKGKSILGVRTTKKVKRVGCSSVADMFAMNHIVVHDAATIEEFTTFVSNSVSYEAENGKHDDMVMNHVLFSWFVTQPFFAEVVGLESGDMRSGLYGDEIENIDEELAMFALIDDGVEEDTPALSSEDIAWLQS